MSSPDSLICGRSGRTEEKFVVFGKNKRWWQRQSKCGKIQRKIKEYLCLRNFAARYFNEFLKQIEQEIQQCKLEVRKITVSGADFWSFEASWRSTEAAEISNTPQVSSNQLDLSQIF